MFNEFKIEIDGEIVYNDINVFAHDISSARMYLIGNGHLDPLILRSRIKKINDLETRKRLIKIYNAIEFDLLVSITTYNSIIAGEFNSENINDVLEHSNLLTLLEGNFILKLKPSLSLDYVAKEIKLDSEFYESLINEFPKTDLEERFKDKYFVACNTFSGIKACIMYYLDNKMNMLYGRRK